jgi:hypothetical protein
LSPCLNCCSSEGVSIAEVAEVGRFVGGEGGWVNFEELSDCIAKPPLNIANVCARRRQYPGTARADKQDRPDHLAASALDMVGEEGRAHHAGVVYQDIPGPGRDIAIKDGTNHKPFHRAGAGVQRPVGLHDICYRVSASPFRIQFGNRAWDSVVAALLDRHHGHIDDIAPKPLPRGIEVFRSDQIASEPTGGKGVATLCRPVVWVPFQWLVVPEGCDRLVAADGMP